MILPVSVIGSPVLKKIAKEIDKDYPGLQELIQNMFETMYHSEGLGLAAPQVDFSVRLFVIDAKPMEDDDPTLSTFKIAFINPKIIEEYGEEWVFNEGCLSVPGLREDIKRKSKVHITYYDENFEFHDEHHDGVRARIIQHEYDHLEGKLFTDRLSPLKKQLLKGRIASISKGDFDIKYKVKIAAKKSML
jgi:peptide deformylase